MKYTTFLLYNDILMLYNAVQYKPFAKIELPVEFKEFGDMLEDVFKEKFISYTGGFGVGDLKTNNRVGVSFSGGRDSAALSFKLREMGYDVTLFHSIGVNPAYADERQYTETFGRKYKFPVFLMKHPVRVVKGAYVENVAKNMLLLSQILHLGQPYGITSAGLGSESSFGEQLLDYGFSDSYLALDAFRKSVAKLLPVQLHVGLFEKESHTYAYLKSWGVDFADIVSCMMPIRYRGKLNKQKLEQGITIRPGGCGSCYKCAQDYLYMSREGLLPSSDKDDLHYYGVLRRHWMHIFRVEPVSHEAFIRQLVNADIVDVDALVKLIGTKYDLKSW